MSWISDQVEKLAINKIVVKIANYLNGKKTAIGAVNFLLWVAIYAMPAFGPQYNWLTKDATILRDMLMSNGLNLDNELFNAGVGFTVVGLAHKVLKYFQKD